MTNPSQKAAVSHPCRLEGIIVNTCTLPGLPEGPLPKVFSLESPDIYKVQDAIALSEIVTLGGGMRHGSLGY